MDRDFKVHEDGIDPWEVEVSEDEDLVIFLNRLAIASSQEAADEHPVAEITAGKKRSSVTAIRGRLFYSDLHQVNVQNVSVIAEEIVGFLTDRIRPGAHELGADRSSHEAEPVSRGRARGMDSVRVIRGAAILFLVGILAFCGVRVYETLSYRPRLVERPSFVPGGTEKRAFFEQYSGCFLDVPKSAGQIVEIGEDGRFRLYEIWSRSSGDTFFPVLVEDLPLALGTSDGRDAALGGEIYLVLPEDENTVTLFGQRFTRYDKQADKLSLWKRKRGG